VCVCVCVCVCVKKGFFIVLKKIIYIIHEKCLTYKFIISNIKKKKIV
jgi:hypothetical protein